MDRYTSMGYSSNSDIGCNAVHCWAFAPSYRDKGSGQAWDDRGDHSC